MRIRRFTNRQCISVGVTVNWNWRNSIEIDLLFWTFSIEWGDIKRGRI